MRRFLTLATATLALSACATPTVYQPAASARAVGFAETRIEADRYRVSFRGGGGAPVAQVQDYALLRAAELAIANGYDWFRVTDRFVEQVGGGSGGGPRVSLGGGSSSFGRRSSVGLGAGVGFDLSGGPQLAATLEILLGRGPAPRERDVYDARDVQRSIRARA
jgi:hypothetical protein